MEFQFHHTLATRLEQDLSAHLGQSVSIKQSGKSKGALSIKYNSLEELDGVLERHPGLKGAAVELGAGWVPELIRRLDWVSKVYSRVDESVRFERPPSEQI